MITQISDRERQLEAEVTHLGELLKEANKECAELRTERDELKAQVAEWVRQNSPSGWIDALRTEINALNMRVEHDFKRWQEAIANYDFERSLSEKLMDGSAKLSAENAALRTERDELKAAAKLGLDALAKTVWSDGKERWIVSEKELNIAITALRGY